MATVTTQTRPTDDFIVGALILGGIIAAIAWRTLFNDSQSDDEVLNVIPSRKLRKKLQEEDDEQDAIIIAVDATPKRVGGILRLPKHKRLYYYSFYWTDHFSFPQKAEAHQKFEMANALVALVVFQSDIQFFRHRYKKLLVKTDNKFFLEQDENHGKKTTDPSSSKSKTYDAQKLFDKVYDRLHFYQGEWREAHKDGDIDMWQASELSKTGSLQYIPSGYNTYEITDWSVQARLATEANMKQRINNKYYHAVDDYY